MNHISKPAALYALLTLLVSAALLSVLSPHKTQSFVSQGVLGRPWEGELLVAPYNFPIYKSEALLQHERDSVRRSVIPYYSLDTRVGAEVLSQWEADWSAVWRDRLNNNAYYDYMRNFLEQVYMAGLIEEEELSTLRQEHHLEINLMIDTQTKRLTPLTQFYSLKEAYQLSLLDVPSGLSPSRIKEINIANYLKTNVQRNEAITQKVIDDELRSIPNSRGMVQEGQRIIDQGEIVNADTHDILESLRRVSEERQRNSLQQRVTSYIGSFLILSALLGSVWLFLLFYRPQIIEEYRNTLFFTILIVTFVALTIYVSRLPFMGLVYIIPYVVVAILVRTFFESRTAIYIYLCTILISALYIPFPLEFIIIQFVSGLVAIFSLRSLTSRAQLIRATFLVFVVYNVVSCSYSLLKGGGLSGSDVNNLLLFAFNLIFNMFSYLLVYLIEKAFGYVSNISLVELSDVNRPLPRMLSERAPGTFQHSMQMALLASDAAAAIGADTRLIRAGAIYHDVGKMMNPAYFTENQGAVNPHDALSPIDSAAIIIRHVSDGLALAQKHKLPQALQDFIRMHHGRGMTKYFYNRYCNENPDKVVDKELFTYPGPNPNTRETGILMLADAIEASSRSLKDLNRETLVAHVNKIVDGIVAEGLLNNTPLTFRDIQTIKEVFCDKLSTIYHSRIAYPELKRKPEAEASPRA